MLHPTLMNQLTETHISDLRMAAAKSYRADVSSRRRRNWLAPRTFAPAALTRSARSRSDVTTVIEAGSASC
jgi:hypothetical protein